MSYGRVYSSARMNKPEVRSVRSDTKDGAIGDVFLADASDYQGEVAVTCYSSAAAREIAEAFLELARQMQVIEDRLPPEPAGGGQDG